ncbi:MAG: hypothetical protein ACF8XB_03035, partial [Planctomycetota bacterium JB042]
MTAPLSPDLAPTPRPARLAAAVACASAALALAWWRTDLALLPMGTSGSAGLLVALLTAAVAVAVRARRGRLEPLLAASIAAGGAFLLSGLVELPKWPSIEAVGRTLLFFPLTAIALSAAWIGAADRRRPLADVGLAAFVVLTTCGGPLFVRVADEYHALLLLFAIPLVLALPHGLRGVLSVPFSRLGAALLTVSALVALTTVDLDRHLHGLTRLALALVPLAVLGLGAPRTERAWFVARAFGWSAGAAVGAASLGGGGGGGVVGP